MSSIKSSKLSRLSFIAISVVPIALLGLLLSTQFGPTKSMAPGTPLLYDDFEYSATVAEETSNIGSERVDQGQSFYIVDVKVANRAERVDHTINPKVISCSPTGQKPLKPDAKAQATLDSLVSALGATVKRTLKPGEFETYRRVFVGSSGLTKLKVSFQFGGGIGTFLDNIVYGKREILVPVTKH